MSGLLRVWALETRGAIVGAKAHCRACGRPIVWMTTVKNGKQIAIDGHEPSPLQTERDVETGRTIELHDRGTVHFDTCAKRKSA